MRRAALLVLALVLVAGPAWALRQTRSDLAEAREELRAAESEQRRLERQLEVAQQAVAEEELTEIIQQHGQELRNGTGTPIVTAAGPLCQGDELEALGDMGLSFLLVANRSGAPCSLVDHPAVLGRQADGTWVPVAVQPSLGRSYSDGPPWTGVFDPARTAVFGIQVPEPVDGTCPSSPTTPATYDAVRLVVDPTGPPFEVGSRLVVGECRPFVQLWSYDVGGEG